MRAPLLLLLLAPLLASISANNHGGGHSGGGGSSGSRPSADAATADDLPKLGVNGAPVLTVDGRPCAFPWSAADGVPHTTCAELAGVVGHKLWCKDAEGLWGVCAAPPKPPGRKADKKNRTASVGDPNFSNQVPSPPDGMQVPTDSALPLIYTAAAPPTVTPAPAPAPSARPRASAATAAAMQQVRLRYAARNSSAVRRNGTNTTTAAAAAAAAAATAAAPAAAATLLPTTLAAASSSTPAFLFDPQPPPLPSLKDSRGPVSLSSSQLDTVERLRGAIRAADAAATDPGSDAATAARANATARFLAQELSAVLTGFMDVSSVSIPAGSPAAAATGSPLCLAPGEQCGGIAAGSNTETWRGAGTCCGSSNASGTLSASGPVTTPLTCVQTNPDFAQCVSVTDSRSRGCGALYAQCGGDFWGGPSCCAVSLGCMYQSQAYSWCESCAKAYEQCAGTAVGGAKVGPKCCPSGFTCKQSNAYYSQCVPQSSG